ncbi:hypothetical protein AZ22_2705 [Bordetella bronchiseptica 980-2]|nr:hypothetical protein AZ22_2705 [Bordetella bronchiseptica 980-2]KDB64868.1 hypothetical protein AZ16_2768 [Bordetella bronchiseptica B18-5 (C3)]KDB70471.1 hypothetical protein AZ21_2854 [Bordetella bronchiseptica B20-10725633]KDB80610.1 hypothetical protein L495_2670 [Bordetella bronchiseptica CARE970018BB]KDB91098.1 hypothetical protein AZ17_2793 [Bordetella bronchiseptica D989]KDC78662.1 hypothetical protein L514_2634 [Bordetella bronchiseptica MBORD635]KDC86463.1 hypothetical protein L5
MPSSVPPARRACALMGCGNHFRVLFNIFNINKLSIFFNLDYLK